MPSQLPVATPVKPLFRINEKIYRRIPHSEGLENADAIRGLVPIASGPDKGGYIVGWFVLLPVAESGGQRAESEQSTTNTAPAGGPPQTDPSPAGRR